MALPSKSEIQDALLRALERMKNDDPDLFRINVNERTLTQRLALYMQENLAEWRVDCEYNRHGDIPKRLDTLRRKRREVFPDIIVHRRGVAGPNLLVIEAKKSSDLNPDSEAFDYLKLREYKREFRYRSTAFVVFFTDEIAPNYKVDFKLPKAQFARPRRIGTGAQAAGRPKSRRSPGSRKS